MRIRTVPCSRAPGEVFRSAFRFSGTPKRSASYEPTIGQPVASAGVTRELLDAVAGEMGHRRRTPTRWGRACALRKAGTFTRASTCGIRSRPISSLSSRRLCQPWARLLWQEASIRRKIGAPEENITEVHRIVRWAARIRGLGGAHTWREGCPVRRWWDIAIHEAGKRMFG
jgi:hypothetical protein